MDPHKGCYYSGRWGGICYDHQYPECGQQRNCHLGENNFHDQMFSCQNTVDLGDGNKNCCVARWACKSQICTSVGIMLQKNCKSENSLFLLGCVDSNVHCRSPRVGPDRIYAINQCACCDPDDETDYKKGEDSQKGYMSTCWDYNQNPNNGKGVMDPVNPPTLCPDMAEVLFNCTRDRKKGIQDLACCFPWTTVLRMFGCYFVLTKFWRFEQLLLLRNSNLDC